MPDKQKLFGETVREFRERKGLLLRQVAAALEVDTAFLSKMERNGKRASRPMIDKLANALGVKTEELLTLWLSDKLIDVLGAEDEIVAYNALKVTEKRLKEKNE